MDAVSKVVRSYVGLAVREVVSGTRFASQAYQTGKSVTRATSRVGRAYNRITAPARVAGDLIAGGSKGLLPGALLGATIGGLGLPGIAAGALAGFGVNAANSAVQSIINMTPAQLRTSSYMAMAKRLGVLWVNSGRIMCGT
jgi:hypothetical protein